MKPCTIEKDPPCLFIHWQKNSGRNAKKFYTKKDAPGSGRAPGHKRVRGDGTEGSDLDAKRRKKSSKPKAKSAPKANKKK